MTSTIKTAVRVRPLLHSELEQHYKNTKLTLNTHKNEISLIDTNKKSFKCDFLLPQETEQEEVFNKCGVTDMVDKALQGYHSTIFAYGQTGSGKSYTMQGGQTPKSAGLTSRVVHCLFDKIKERQGKCKYTVWVSFIQIYSQRIYDLLNPASLSNRTLNFSQGIEGLRLRWNKDQQFTVENMFIFECRDQAELTKYVNLGLKNRISSSHKLNLQSSRSHSILSIKIEGNDGNTIRNSRIELVDLAGSERIGMTGTEGRLAKESIDINKSLFTLRQVINVLSEGNMKRKDQKLYVPYRDSKLTSILKQSIGGNSYSLMIACLTPNDAFFQENLSTLTYTTRASFITNNPTPNLDQHSKAMQQLRRQLTQVTSELSKANQHIQFLTSLVQNAPKQSRESPRKKQIENEQEGQLPQPVFKKRLTERINGNFDSNISERLIESINMVRQLLKSNKQLREKLELTGQTIQQKNNEIFDLTRQNQILREGRDFPISYEQEFKNLYNNVKNQTKPQTVDTRRHPLRIPEPIQRTKVDNHQHQQPITKRQGIPTGVSLDIGKIYMNQKGVDSAPTNFNKRATNTSQDKRIGYSRGSIDQQDRHAITAKFSKRGWLSKEGDVKKFLSFYEDLREAQAYDFNR